MTINIDNTTKLKILYRRVMVKCARENAHATQKALKESFVRRSPRVPQKQQQPQLYYYSENGKKIMTMSEFVKILKNQIQKEEHGEHPRSTLYTGGVFSSRRKKKYKKTADTINQKQALKEERRQQNREKKGRNRSRLRKKDTHWVDTVFKTTRDTPKKMTSSMPGTPPVSWKNVNRGIKGHPQRSYPDYYLRNSVRMTKIDDLTYEVFILPFHHANKILKILEEGGSFSRTQRILVGYFRKNYRLSSHGKKIGNKRIRFFAKFLKRNWRVNIEPRPFLGPVDQDMRKRTLDYFKK